MKQSAYLDSPEVLNFLRLIWAQRHEGKLHSLYELADGLIVLPDIPQRTSLDGLFLEDGVIRTDRINETAKIIKKKLLLHFPDSTFAVFYDDCNQTLSDRWPKREKPDSTVEVQVNGPGRRKDYYRADMYKILLDHVKKEADLRDSKILKPLYKVFDEQSYPENEGRGIPVAFELKKNLTEIECWSDLLKVGLTKKVGITKKEEENRFVYLKTNWQRAKQKQKRRNTET